MKESIFLLAMFFVSTATVANPLLIDEPMTSDGQESTRTYIGGNERHISPYVKDESWEEIECHHYFEESTKSYHERCRMLFESLCTPNFEESFPKWKQQRCGSFRKRIEAFTNNLIDMDIMGDEKSVGNTSFKQRP